MLATIILILIALAMPESACKVSALVALHLLMHAHSLIGRFSVLILNILTHWFLFKRRVQLE